MSIFSELKRRNVVRSGIAYVVGAWLVLQVADVLMPAFGFEDSALRLLTIGLAIGLVPVLIFAWAFEFTPQGLKTDRKASEVEPDRKASAKTFDRWIMVGLALALGVFAFDKFILDPGRDAELARTASEAGAEQALEDLRQGIRPAKSIAVLPFEIRSGGADDDYFTDGIHGELLTRLSKINALRVIAQTSVLRFRDSDLTPAQIARELAVSTILQGVVQRAGGQVRINVQLVDPEADELLWAEVYDRELTASNLFALQSEISRAIATTLETELSPETSAALDEVPTGSTEAYDLYLLALQELRTSDWGESFLAMKSLLERAVELDPDFLDAQILLAETYGRIHWVPVDSDPIYPEWARERVEIIRQRWPDRVEGHLAQGQYHYLIERDYERALAEYRVFEGSYPNDIRALQKISGSLKRLGRFSEQLPYARRWFALDPENTVAAAELMYALRFNGMGDETLAMAELGLERFPEDRGWARDLTRYRLLFRGEVDEYLAFAESMREDGSWFVLGAELGWMLLAGGDEESALEYSLARVPPRGWNAIANGTDYILIRRAVGRDDEAEAGAALMIEGLRGVDTSNPGFPQTTMRRWWTWMAYAAAVAGDSDLTNQFHELALSAPEDDPMLEQHTILRLGKIEALQGDPVAGWAVIAEALDDGYSMITPDYAAVHPLYLELFGDAPEFQAFIASAGEP